MTKGTNGAALGRWSGEGTAGVGVSSATPPPPRPSSPPASGCKPLIWESSCGPVEIRLTFLDRHLPPDQLTPVDIGGGGQSQADGRDLIGLKKRKCGKIKRYIFGVFSFFFCWSWNAVEITVFIGFPVVSAPPRPPTVDISMTGGTSILSMINMYIFFFLLFPWTSLYPVPSAVNINWISHLLMSFLLSPFLFLFSCVVHSITA